MSGAIAIAADAQRLASDPGVSAFVSASAGSGKTKLLIDRLLRLMLPRPGRPESATPPERILCLTFTKAGAAEMAIRLRRTLGQWVIDTDDKLDAELRALDLPPDAATRDAARALFARVLDIPGGLRIGTIHAFCEQLLRRFPLEAAISPYFRVVEDNDARSAMQRAREGAVGNAAADAVALLAARLDATRHTDLTRELHQHADRLAHAHALEPAALAAALGQVLDIAHNDERALLAHATGVTSPDLLAALRTIRDEGADKQSSKASAMLDWLAGDHTSRQASWAEWRAFCLTGAGDPRSFLASNTKLYRTRPDLVAILAAEAARVVAVEGQRVALQLIEATAALLALSGPSLAAYEAEKRALGLLDFNDLIRRTERLLADPGVAWVLFKLDGGLDHLLLDEVQDTSSSQWKIAGRLTEEFFAGETAQTTARTIFAVGDVKQSIYSFQGADPEGFRTWRDIVRSRVAGAGQMFREPSLTVSFRSSPIVLAFVDAVFADARAAAGLAEPGQPVPGHLSARSTLPGQVELWPLATGDEADTPETPWQAPTDNHGLATSQQNLARTLAAHLAGLIRAGDVRPGEILVLFRRRTAFVGSLMRALKALDVPVAGNDRMVLTDQPAVQDLIALCDALLLPSDDLSLAVMLTSPLGGLDDASLMDLAIDRPVGGTLWAALQDRHAERPDWRAAHDLFANALARIDFVGPHTLLSGILGVGGGRARFLARLGPEAAEAIDELLAASLAYAARHVPSMQGFVHWLRRAGAEIKSEGGENQDEIRLMTVHGSKGLEARLVVVADTASLPIVQDAVLWSGAGAAVLPIWTRGAAGACPAITRMRDEAQARALEEYDRLLYVALTRARQRLIVCGWAPSKGEVKDESWYAHCARAFDAFEAAGSVAVETSPFVQPEWGDLRLIRQGGVEPQTAERAARSSASPLPAWAGNAPSWQARPPPPEPAPRRSLIPSRPEGVVFGPVPPAASPRSDAGRAARRHRGETLHALLQHLPSLAPSARPDAARRFVASRQEDDPDALVAQALAIIDHPALGGVFGALGRAEQRVAGLVGDVAVSGVVDRMAIGAGGVTLVDFKSGRLPPRDAVLTPVRYLRQMAAYRGVLQALRPGLGIACLLVWTDDATVMPLPDALLDAHAPGVASA
jgi:ATP-dependent helicase/nuclease subunit A